jgi:hypothetical protein
MLFFSYMRCAGYIQFKANKTHEIQTNTKIGIDLIWKGMYLTTWSLKPSNNQCLSEVGIYIQTLYLLILLVILALIIILFWGWFVELIQSLTTEADSIHSYAVNSF